MLSAENFGYWQVFGGRLAPFIAISQESFFACALEGRRLVAHTVEAKSVLAECDRVAIKNNVCKLAKIKSAQFLIP